MISFKIASTQIFMTEIFNIYISGTWSFTMFRIYICQAVICRSITELFRGQIRCHVQEIPVATCGERQTQYRNVWGATNTISQFYATLFHLSCCRRNQLNKEISTCQNKGRDASPHISSHCPYLCIIVKEVVFVVFFQQVVAT